MNQLFALALVIGIFVHDLAQSSARPSDAIDQANHPILWLLLIAALVAVAIFNLLTRRTARQLTALSLRRFDRIWSVYRVIILLLFGAALRHGALRLIRATTGDIILIDELIMLAGPIAMLVAGFASHYTLEKRLYEASLIRRIDSGMPVTALAPRSRFVLMRIRSELGLALGPLLLIMAWLETVNTFIPIDYTWQRIPLAPTVQFIGAAIIFIFSPVIVRYLWNTTPMPEGIIRQRITDLCQTHHVRVRQCLLWITQSDGSIGITNAAVMGLLSRFRYILITDALIQRMPVDQVEAVIAHELGHVKRQHLFWLLMVAIALLIGSEIIAQFAIDTYHANATTVLDSTDTMDGYDNTDSSGNTTSSDTLNAAAFLTLGLWIITFGWVSRRFERQADTFAVQHFALTYRSENNAVGFDGFDNANRITDAAIENMRAALLNVAQLNHTNPRKRSWRHGSIAWRCNYLATLIDKNPEQLPIDRTIARIKIITGFTVIGFLAYELFFTLL